MLTLSIISAAILWGFIALSVGKFGIPSSFSETYYLWQEPSEGYSGSLRVEGSGLFCIISGIAGGLLVPVMIERGAGDIAQCLGFFCPAFLIMVAALPDFRGGQKVAHSLAAVISALGAISWELLICRVWWPLAASAALVAVLSILTKTTRKSAVFWAEMAAFASVYLILLCRL